MPNWSNNTTIEQKLFDIMQQIEYCDSAACDSRDRITNIEDRLRNIEDLLSKIISDTTLLKEDTHTEK